MSDNDQEQADKMKQDMNNPRYWVTGPGTFNLSKWLRENVEQPPPQFKVGDVVTITITREITKVGQDCDGTTLYGIDGLGFGWPEGDHLRLATDEEAKNF